MKMLIKTHAYKEKLKENAYKSKQTPAGNFSGLAGMKFDFPM